MPDTELAVDRVESDCLIEMIRTHEEHFSAIDSMFQPEEKRDASDGTDYAPDHALRKVKAVFPYDTRKAPPSHLFSIRTHCRPIYYTTTT